MTKEILVLTTAPGAGVLNAAILNQIAETVPGLPTADILARDEAAEFALPDDQSTAALTDAVRASVQDKAVDINVVPARGRRKKLLVADMESTIIEQECLDELAADMDVQEKMVDITARAMRGELDFEPALRARVAMLAGLPVSALQNLYDTRVSLMPGAATLLATLNAHATTCGLVSGGFRFFAEKIAARLDFDLFQCNDLDIAEHALTGRVLDPILGRTAKADIMQTWCSDLGLTPADVIAVGDGSNDLAMLGAAGMGVAFRAKPTVAAAAKVTIDHGDLTALLYLQGYKKSDFASA
ncbi:MAG TPA: phosphoserine phosphatase SerB [Rhodobiaceae bacterium]|nr:phosphoserine phosphatase SerB [Rhodobiaceae bacterium]|tara:strand:+ start:593 stop:1489 length:897 start_codon:yes stop_codon:yes gene_type:complete